MTVLNVKIPSPLADYVEELVEQGRYPTAEDAVADALTRLQVEEPETLEFRVWLRAEVRKGIDDIEAGRVVDWDRDAIMREVDRRLQPK